MRISLEDGTQFWRWEIPWVEVIWMLGMRFDLFVPYQQVQKDQISSPTSISLLLDWWHSGWFLILTRTRITVVVVLTNTLIPYLIITRITYVTTIYVTISKLIKNIASKFIFYHRNKNAINLPCNVSFDFECKQGRD